MLHLPFQENFLRISFLFIRVSSGYSRFEVKIFENLIFIYITGEVSVLSLTQRMRLPLKYFCGINDFAEMVVEVRP
jgi:hypothetical protein